MFKYTCLNAISEKGIEPFTERISRKQKISGKPTRS